MKNKLKNQAGQSRNRIREDINAQERDRQPMDRNLGDENPNMDENSDTAAPEANERTDRQFLEEINRAIKEGDNIPQYIKNIEVFVEDERVVIKGTVRSEEEKTSIGDKVMIISEYDRPVDNQLTVVEWEEKQ